MISNEVQTSFNLHSIQVEAFPEPLDCCVRQPSTVDASLDLGERAEGLPPLVFLEIEDGNFPGRGESDMASPEAPEPGLPKRSQLLSDRVGTYPLTVVDHLRPTIAIPLNVFECDGLDRGVGLEEFLDVVLVDADRPQCVGLFGYALGI